jgi:hypothetical protein
LPCPVGELQFFKVVPTPVGTKRVATNTSILEANWVIRKLTVVDGFFRPMRPAKWTSLFSLVNDRFRYSSAKSESLLPVKKTVSFQHFGGCSVVQSKVGNGPAAVQRLAPICFLTYTTGRGLRTTE